MATKRGSYVDPVSARFVQQRKGKAFGVTLKPVMRKADFEDPPAANGTEVDHEADDSNFGSRKLSQCERHQCRHFLGMERWREKVAVITGASSGIGAATARRLVEEGMIVVGGARRLDQLEILKSQLPTGKFHPIKCDVTVEAEVVALFERVERKFGHADVLINNAGVAHCTSLIEPSAEALEALFAVNVIGACVCNREFLRLYRKQSSKSQSDGYIMFTNSISGHVVAPSIVEEENCSYFYAYTASKHALKAIVEGLRQELRSTGSKIRVGEVSPGEVCGTEISSTFATFGTTAQQQKSVEKYSEQRTNSTDSLLAEDVADAFVYMLSTPERADVNEIVIRNKTK